MGKLIYSMIMSLDGYVEDKHGRFGWGAPEDQEVYAYVNQRASSVRTSSGDRRGPVRSLRTIVRFAMRLAAGPGRWPVRSDAPRSAIRFTRFHAPHSTRLSFASSREHRLEGPMLMVSGRFHSSGLDESPRTGYSGLMKKASITEAKNNLSALIDSVKGGSPVLIVDRGRPVARLEPVSGIGSDDDRLARLVREGVVRPARGAPRKGLFSGRPPRAKKGASGVRTLLAERREGR
jgi:prevent-host-death family protein